MYALFIKECIKAINALFGD